MNAASLSSSSKPSESHNALDIDKILNREASAFQREVEVERILKAFKLKCVPYIHKKSFNNLHIIYISPYDILDINETATADEIKKKFRHLSLCIIILSLSCSMLVDTFC